MTKQKNSPTETINAEAAAVRAKLEKLQAKRPTLEGKIEQLNAEREGRAIDAALDDPDAVKAVRGIDDKLAKTERELSDVDRAHETLSAQLTTIEHRAKGHQEADAVQSKIDDLANKQASFERFETAISELEAVWPDLQALNTGYCQFPKVRLVSLLRTTYLQGEGRSGSRWDGTTTKEFADDLTGDLVKELGQKRAEAEAPMEPESDDLADDSIGDRRGQILSYPDRPTIPWGNKHVTPQAYDRLRDALSAKIGATRNFLESQNFKPAEKDTLLVVLPGGLQAPKWVVDEINLEDFEPKPEDFHRDAA